VSVNPNLIDCSSSPIVMRNKNEEQKEENICDIFSRPDSASIIANEEAKNYDPPN
jgi:hypothetical protein